MIKIFIGDFMNKSYHVTNFFENIFILRRTRVANFSNIIKIATTFIKTTFRDSKKVNKIRKFWLENADVSRTQEVFHIMYIYIYIYILYIYIYIYIYIYTYIFFNLL